MRTVEHNFLRVIRYFLDDGYLIKIIVSGYTRGHRKKLAYVIKNHQRKSKHTKCPFSKSGT